MFSDLKPKINRLFNHSGADCIVLMNTPAVDPNFFYFTRLEKSEFSSSVLILKSNGSSVLIVPKMEYELAKVQCRKAGIAIKPFSTADEFKKLLVSEIKCKKIGLNLSRLSVNTFRSLKKILEGKKFLDLSKSLAKIRRTKTRPEIVKIDRACKIASKVMGEVPKFMKIGMKEKELAAEIDRRMKMYGADEIAFPTIVAAGKNSSNPHYTAGDGKLKRGDFVTVDFGCKVGNYCSDMTRSLVVGTGVGKISIRQKEMIDTCKKMQDEVIRMSKPGVKIEALQEKANSICNKKYGKMLHRIGHSLGVEVHDPTGGAKELEEGMVVTVEPGIYIKGFGGVRIEDDILITKMGCKILTKN